MHWPMSPLMQALRFGYFLLDEWLVRPDVCKEGAQLLLGISRTQGIQPDALFLVFMPQREPALPSNGIAGDFQKRQQCIKILRLLFKGYIYRHAQKIAV